MALPLVCVVCAHHIFLWCFWLICSCVQSTVEIGEKRNSIENEKFQKKVGKIVTLVNQAIELNWRTYFHGRLITSCFRRKFCRLNCCQTTTLYCSGFKMVAVNCNGLYKIDLCSKISDCIKLRQHWTLIWMRCGNTENVNFRLNIFVSLIYAECCCFIFGFLRYFLIFSFFSVYF